MNHNEHKAGRKRGVLFVSLVIVVVLGWFAHGWWFSEERAIRRRLNQLAEIVSVPAGDTELGRVTRVARLRGYLAEDIRLRTGSQQLASRDALLATVGRFTPPPGGLRVELVDLQVTVGRDRVSAEVYLDVKMTSPGNKDARTGEPAVDAREANVTMAKRQGDWVVTSAETRETLQRP